MLATLILVKHYGERDGLPDGGGCRVAKPSQNRFYAGSSVGSRYTIQLRLGLRWVRTN